MAYVPLKKTSASARKGQYLLVHTGIFKIYDFFEISYNTIDYVTSFS
jgi:hydrogenase maturation factor